MEQILEKNNRIEKKVEPSKKWKLICNKYNVSYHKLDWTTISKQQNDFTKEGFEEYIINEIKKHSKIDKKDELELDLEQFSKTDIKQLEQEKSEKELEQHQKETEKQYQKILREVKATPTPNIAKITWKLREFIRLVLSNKTDKHTLVIIGKAGIGKTYTTKSVLREFFKPDELTKVIRNGHTTALSYYNLLYDNPNGIFFFDDVSGLYRSETGISLMKQSSETDKKRLICYSSTTGKLEHRATQFFFEGNQILCMNDYPKNKDFLPIVSRIRPIVFNPTYKEIIIMMVEIIKERYKDIPLKEKIKIVEFIEKHTNQATKNFDLRLLNDFVDLYRYNKGINDKFKEMANMIIEVDLVKEIVLDLEKEKNIDKVDEFRNRTGLSKRTYERYRNQMGLTWKYSLKNI